MEAEKKQNSFRLPMIEIVIILGVFAVISVLIAKMFVSTDQIRSKAENISRAVLETESIAEILKGRDVSKTLFEEIGAKESQNTDSTYFIYYDKFWNTVKEDAKNVIIIHYTETDDEYGGMITYQISAYTAKNDEEFDESEKPLCDLIVKKLK